MYNEEFFKYFKQPMELDSWVACVNGEVGKWVSKKGLGYWELVRFVSKKRGILKNNVGREKFGEILIKLCPNAVSKNSTPKSLKYNMDKFDYRNELETFERLDKWHPLVTYFEDLNTLFDMQDQDMNSSSTNGTNSIEQLLRTYLQTSVNTHKYAKVCERPTYCNYTSTFSVEQFVSQDFYDQDRPSHIIVYECVDERVDDNMVLQLASRYMNDRRIKLYIASPYGYDNHTISTADDRQVGLIRINPNQQLNEHSFILPRSQETHSVSFEYKRMMKETKGMVVPLIIRDMGHYTNSLAEELKFYNVEVNDSNLHVVPDLSDEEIEEATLTLIQNDVSFYESLLVNFDYHRHDVPKCIIAPFQIANQRQLKVVRKNLSDLHELAYIDLTNRIVYLNTRVETFSPRERFSMGHELGHDVLHGKLNVSSFSDTSSTMSLSSYHQRLLEKQANIFASCLLMPARLVKPLYEIYWHKEFGPGDIRPLILDCDAKSVGIYQRIVGPLSRKMGVSLEAMKIRLLRLGLAK
jgi:Zn-dependent peptidase ImmA (M78 family)